MVNRVSTDKIIGILALMWEHVDKKQYDLRELVIKILSRIGYSTSAIIADKDYIGKKLKNPLLSRGMAPTN